MTRQRWTVVWMVALALSPVGATRAEDSDDATRRARLEVMMEGNRERFPAVPEVTAEALEALLADGSATVLVDVRTDEERAVSMIPGAITLETLEARADELAGSRIVTYCHSGGRSAQQAERLISAGWDAYSLNGSLLLWSHHGGELVGPGGEPTRRVATSEGGAAALASGYEPVF